MDSMSEYRVQTETYSGPMGLLLYLIRRDEIDLYDIPVAQIAGQYCAYVETLKAIDPNVAGEFLVMAATLMELKSRMLLPRPVTEEGEPEDLADPRLELVRQLLEYKKFKDASFELDHAARRQALRWARAPAGPISPAPTQVDLEDVQIWDLVGAFNRIMSAIGAGRVTHDVVFDDTPIALHAVDILDQLQHADGELTFEAIFNGRTRVEMIGLFLALLELIRQARVRVAQHGTFDAIRIQLLSAEPIEVGEEWESALSETVLDAGVGGRDETASGSEHAPDLIGLDDPAMAEGEAAGAGEVGPKPLVEDADVEDDDVDIATEMEALKVDVDIEAVAEREPSAADNPRATETPEGISDR